MRWCGMDHHYSRELLRTGIIEASGRFLNGVTIAHTSTENFLVKSFRLNLMPVWMTEFPFNGKMHLLLINGQNGAVVSDLSPEGESDSEKMPDILSDLLGD